MIISDQHQQNNEAQAESCKKKQPQRDKEKQHSSISFHLFNPLYAL
jgi:hypothetical protein